MPIAVAIVEDHAVLADTLAAALAREAGFEVVVVARNATEAASLAELGRVDVALVDFRLPDGDGIEVAGRLRRASPSTQVVMLSADDSDELVARAVRAGCIGFVPKTAGVDEVIAALRAAAAGEARLPASALTRVLREAARQPGPPMLTERELHVLRLLASGAATADIAASLFLSTHTVRNHVRSVLAKLGAHSRLEAVAIARRDGLLGEDRG